MSTSGFGHLTQRDIDERNARLRRAAVAPRPLPPLPPMDTAASRIGAPALPRQNTGRWLEELIQASADRYAAANVLTLRKNEPPCRIIGGGSARKVIFLDNPWLDFSGNWTERHARHLLIECKSTDGETLRIQQESGLTVRQCKALRDWIDRGSAAMVIWGHTPTRTIRAVPAGAVFRAIADGRKHLKPADGVPCAMMGLALADFAPALRTFFR